MAEKKVEEKVLSARDLAWQKYLAAYKADNPVKFAAKEARGEFKSIPDSFKGR